MNKLGLRNKKRNDLIFYICLMAIPVVQFCIFYVGVNLNSILLAFKTLNINTLKYEFAGLVNFKQVWIQLTEYRLLGTSFKNSIIVYIVGLTVGLTLGLLYPYYIYKKKLGHKFFKIVLFMPSIISSVVLVTMFKYFAEEVIPAVIHSMLGINAPGLLSGNNSFGWIIFYNIWIGFGSGVIMYVGAMSRISESIVESAQLDGANLLQEFLKITLPMVWPTLNVFLTVGIAGFFMDQANLFTFYRDNPPDPNLTTLGYYIYRLTYAGGPAQYPYLSALGLLMTFIAAPLTFIVRHFLLKYGPSVN